MQFESKINIYTGTEDPSNMELACICGNSCTLGCAYQCLGPCEGSCGFCGNCGSACHQGNVCYNFTCP